ncbi:MAG: hypothetical protein K5905_20855 [Roseibium sp.]|uniref:hypothetical protein n=1 Tax=Roseibium sp. TaxID=1936156 RepID=UPI00262BF497|nr:hypothetical protein [Roseibium sp.]MCV0427915.1 hypothetical protein [Roseibium sp.]
MANRELLAFAIEMAISPTSLNKNLPISFLVNVAVVWAAYSFLLTNVSEQVGLSMSKKKSLLETANALALGVVVLAVVVVIGSGMYFEIQ